MSKYVFKLSGCTTAYRREERSNRFMVTAKDQALNMIESKRESLWSLSDALWDHPETGFHEDYAAQQYCQMLEQEGFRVERDLAGIATAFSGTYGEGGPVIGFLGEFDALPELSQEAGITEQKAVRKGGAGHGCGHNLLGVGSLGAAIGLKQYLQNSGIPGTVKFFGCPAEENGSGKGFMARDGVFQGLDLAFTWHPADINAVSAESSTANYKICYHFHGVSSHAAISPELGRSALDALELMNIGVQFLREHMPSSARVHYAITDTGGSAPGVVQSYAEAMYLIRSPELPQVKELFGRVNRIAQGAALMTDTTVEVEFIKACSNTVLNQTLLKVLQKNMEEIPSDVFDAQDLELAAQIAATYGNDDSYFEELLNGFEDPSLRETVLEDRGKPLHSVVMPYPKETQGVVSSDVGDVSWNCPVAQISATTMPAGTPMHSWQTVAVGKSAMAHKGMLYAAKVLAASAIDTLENPSIIQQAKEEFIRRTGGHDYDSPIPADVKPRL